MTTEEDFQRTLDRQPFDFQTRLVFADWLQDKGDKRADGYRAMARREFLCELVVIDRFSRSGFANQWFFCVGDVSEKDIDTSVHYPYLPSDWFADIVAEPKTPTIEHWRHFRLRETAENSIAEAFAKLPKSIAARYLTGKT